MSATAAGTDRKDAFRFIALMGTVSFFGDVTYEAARSISGPYLASLGGSASAVGFATGFGVFLGYALRLASGYLADRSERYWAFTIAGYAAVFLLPLLALAGSWPVAAGLLIGERIGKAVRTPARDAIISHSARHVGRGIGFGFHEFLDKAGSMAGPLLFSALFLLRGDYRLGLSLLWIPAACAIAALLWARARVPLPGSSDPPAARRPLSPDAASGGAASEVEGRAGLAPLFWAYSAFTFLAVAGFAGFPIMAYHFKARGILGDAAIPVVYALGMGVDAVAALAIGHWYDRKGLGTLALAPALSAAVGALAFLGGAPLAVASMILWGVVMAVHETVMRASIGDLAPAGRRGWAYGVFNTIYGAAWFLGGTVMGFLYDVFPPAAVVGFIALAELASLPFLFRVIRPSPPTPAGSAPP